MVPKQSYNIRSILCGKVHNMLPRWYYVDGSILCR